ncbi:hypothetical protein OJF2_51420 [Aquisphaera giovannonii]|uniref:Uncharacterized protein n=1 Tax=Aquisphaera giovannonii TaxID=406548 RepID=A0A5B9W7K2_9BACT|nr:hypothetical protein [Aquisphaera giovannonii]QEH36558.1 hypothetical protein OJF2_51420 [Aquisphaera giovannonii]
MTHILNEAACWLFLAIVLGPGWFNLSCFFFCLWAVENWRFRL